MSALMPGSRGLTAIRWPRAAGGVALFLVTSPACRAHRTAPLGAFPVPSFFIRLRQPNHPPTQPIATAKLPMATIATGPSHGVYRRHAIPSTPPKEREKVCVCCSWRTKQQNATRWQAVRPAQRRLRRFRGRTDRSDHRSLGQSEIRANFSSHYLIPSRLRRLWTPLHIRMHTCERRATRLNRRL